MKILYLDCAMGASGETLLGALSALGDPAASAQRINALGLEGVHAEAQKARGGGILGTRIQVHAAAPAASRLLNEVEVILSSLALPEDVRQDAAAVYAALAQAESATQGVPAAEADLHEAGSLESIVTIAGTCLLLRELHPDRITASPPALGNGFRQGANGPLPVPAPAVAELIQGMPVRGTDLQGERLTPAGAALLRHFVQDWRNLPAMTILKIGTGCGSTSSGPACLRAFLGEAETAGEIVELVCSMDDITGEEAGFASQELFEAGALEVYTAPIYMKKNRPGILFTCVCRTEQKEEMLRIMFRDLSTLGIREYVCPRHTLESHVETAASSLGPVRRKISRGYGAERIKGEYDDLARLAREKGLSMADIRKLLEEEKVL
jgi:uncharacterized protein (TIGR00299 family) protein